MGFNSGTVSERKLYTGLAKMEVLAINPNKAELEKLGINYKEEPVYTGERSTDGTKYARIDFWLGMKEKNIIVPVKFFVAKKKNISSNDNLQFIDNFGMSTYAASLEVLKERPNVEKWFDFATARQAWEGESFLIDFIKNWLCIPRETIAKIDDWEAIFNGDFKEVKELIGIKQSNGSKYLVQVLLTVDDKGYQAVYDRFSGRMDSLNLGRWTKQFEGLTTKINYGGSFTFKEYTDIVEPDSTKPSNKEVTQENAWTG